MKLAQLIDISQYRLEPLFQHYLIQNATPAQELQNAMAYAVLNGGKRIRPLLIYATGYTLNASWETLDLPASAIELIHAYSLIHDDLPAMDNADLRRGKPSCHKAFSEATAILAGDALQPLAFQLIASHTAPLTAEQRIAMIKILSIASGLDGMAAGQALDLSGTDAILNMYQLKTGALLVACVKLAAVAANIQDPQLITALTTYASNIGLAFQLQDDLLDLESSEITGKTSGLDISNQKTTLATQWGINKTRATVAQLFSDALTAVDRIGERASLLHELATYLLQRKK